VEEVAARLHIRPKYIAALEEGRLQDLPGRVYTMGYLQSYAEFLGLDPAQVVEYYQNLQGAEERPEFRVVEPNQRQGRPAIRILAACIAVLAAGFIAWLLITQQEQADGGVAVEPVPEQLKTRTPLLITPRNRACLQPGWPMGYPPCYQTARYEVPATPFALRPVRSIMEIR